jgi:molecular chaperone GrpE
MVEQQLMEALTRFGVERLKTEGEFFDPARHDAVERVETNEVCEGTIVGEVLPGYALSGRIVRAAKVRVAAEPR